MFFLYLSLIALVFPLPLQQGVPFSHPHADDDKPLPFRGSSILMGDLDVAPHNHNNVRFLPHAPCAAASCCATKNSCMRITDEHIILGCRRVIGMTA